jgi:hypothetical protein
LAPSMRSSHTEHPEKRLHFIPNHRIRSRLTFSTASTLSSMFNACF